MNEQYMLVRRSAGGADSPLQIDESADTGILMDAACLRLDCLRILTEQLARAKSEAPREQELAQVCMVLNLLAGDAAALYEAAFVGLSTQAERTAGGSR